jgi:hypothetical protein
MRHNYFLAFLAVLLLVKDCRALSTWDQVEAMIENKNDDYNNSDYNETHNDFTDTSDSQLSEILDAIEKATQRIKHDLAEELDALTERLPQIIQQNIPPPARVVAAKAGQQLVWAATANQTAPAFPRPRRPALQ